MFKKEQKNGVIEDSKIGKNDNYDIGDNKHNKTKKIDKKALKHIKINSDNIDYDPNHVYVELIREIAQLEKSIARRVVEFKSCPDCLQKLNDAYVETLNKREEILRKYDLEEQLMSNRTFIQYPLDTINKLNNRLDDIANARMNISCDKHYSNLLEINLDRTELNSLKESLKYFNN